jgi:small-conductance mechanosensitive channel
VKPISNAANESQIAFLFKIDAAFENIFNVFFYGIVAVIVLSQLGFDPLAMFLSISGVVLAFAFSKFRYHRDESFRDIISLCNSHSMLCPC